MAKDRFGCRHTTVRPAGFRVRRKVMDSLSFTWVYKRPEVAGFFVELDFGDYHFPIYGLILSFCRACGAFLGLGIRYELCWVCESELEPEEFEDEPEMSF
jgi:hypothetical protein